MVKIGLHPFGTNNKAIIIRQVGSITNDIWRKPVELSLEEWMSAISNGQTSQLGLYEDFVPTTDRKNPTDDCLTSQYALAIDVDNQVIDADGNRSRLSEDDGYLSIDDALKFKDVAFIWRTFNNTDRWNRFRLVYILDQPVFNSVQVKTLYAHLFKRINSKSIDCLTNSNRLFFGSNTYPIPIDLDARLNVESILGRDWRSITTLSPEVDAYINKLNQHHEVDADILKNNLDHVVVDDALSSLKNWQLLAKNTPEADALLSQRLIKYKQTVNDKRQFYNVFKRLDMRKILGIPDAPKTFIDILHDESNPSATIYQSNTKVYLYTVNSKAHRVFWDSRASNTGDVFDVIRTLKHFKTRDDVVHYLIKITDSALINSKVVEQFRRQIEAYIADVFQNEDNDVLFPSFYKLTNSHGRANYMANMLMQIASNVEAVEYLDSNGKKQVELRPMSYMSQETLAGKIGLKSDRKRVQSLQLEMAWLGLIKKLPIQEFPKEIKDMLIKNSMKTHHSLPNVIVPVLAETAEMDDKSKILLQNGYSTRVGVDYYIRLINKLNADVDDAKNEAINFIPRKSKKIEQSATLDGALSKYGKWMEGKIVPYLLAIIDTDGYILESELIDRIKRSMIEDEESKAKEDPTYKIKNVGLSPTYWRSMRQDIFDKYDLVLLNVRNSIKPKDSAKYNKTVGKKSDFIGLIERYPKPTQRPNIITRAKHD